MDDSTTFYLIRVACRCPIFQRYTIEVAGRDMVISTLYLVLFFTLFDDIYASSALWLS